MDELEQSFLWRVLMTNRYSFGTPSTGLESALKKHRALSIQIENLHNQIDKLTREKYNLEDSYADEVRSNYESTKKSKTRKVSHTKEFAHYMKLLESLDRDDLLKILDTCSGKCKADDRGDAL